VVNEGVETAGRGGCGQGTTFTWDARQGAECQVGLNGSVESVKVVITVGTGRDAVEVSTGKVRGMVFVKRVDSALTGA